MDLLLYSITVIFWGTSWLAIKFQLGVVAPEVSVVYRFVMASLLMMAWCLVARRRMRFSAADHGFMALQGVCLFSTNYFLIYLGSQYLTTGLVAVAFSTVVAMNILGSAALFRQAIPPKVAAGALLGLGGITLVFWRELSAFDLSAEGTRGLVLALAGTCFASAGMLTSAWSQRRRGLPVIQSNAWGMVYGALFVTLLTLVRGTPFTFDPSPAYVLSLVYLAAFATVVGFWSYLTLIGRIGASRASYVAVVFPLLALALSTLFEDYQWTGLAAAGVVLVLTGNALVLAKPKPAGPALPESQPQTQTGKT